jgi:fructokinase
MRIGIDLGGTKIEGLVLDGDGNERARLRVATPDTTYDDIVEAIANLVAELEKRVEARCTVGIGHPGAVSPATGLIKNANSTRLNGRPLRADLAAALGQPVALANDANCLALSEATDGAGAGADVVFAVILGTGTGAGIAVHGQVLSGPNGLAGEWGHNPLPWAVTGEDPQRACYCGRRGCIETLLSGPGIARDHGGQVDARHIAAAAVDGDTACAATLQRHAHRLARALASVINLLDPDVIVLAGGVSRIASIYEQVPKLWGQWVFSGGHADAVRTRLVPSRHGDASGVRGAAWLGQRLTSAGTGAGSCG